MGGTGSHKGERPLPAATALRAATREGQKGVAPPKQKFRPPKFSSMSPYPCGCLKMVALLIGDQQRIRRK